MRAALTAAAPARRTLWQRLCRWARIAWVEFDIHCIEDWIADCERDGILTGAQLDGCHWRLQELRCELAALQAS